jgi:hypothetical protein
MYITRGVGDRVMRQDIRREEPWPVDSDVEDEPTQVLEPVNVYRNKQGIVCLYGVDNLAIVRTLETLEGKVEGLLMRDSQQAYPSVQIERVRATRHHGQWRVTSLGDSPWVRKSSVTLVPGEKSDSGTIQKWFFDHPNSGPLIRPDMSPVKTASGNLIPAWVATAEERGEIFCVPTLERAVRCAEERGACIICDALAGGYRIFLYTHPSVFYPVPFEREDRWHCTPPDYAWQYLRVIEGAAIAWPR